MLKLDFIFVFSLLRDQHPRQEDIMHFPYYLSQGAKCAKCCSDHYSAKLGHECFCMLQDFGIEIRSPDTIGHNTTKQTINLI